MDAYLGQIILFAGSYAPEGWAFCYGQTLPINGNEALYSLLGTTYGGDGKTDFGLPDLRCRVPLGAGKGVYSNATEYAVGAKGGVENVTLTTAQLPSHTHTLNASTAQAATSSPAGAVLATVPAEHVFYFNPPPPSGVTATPHPLGADTVQSSGDGEAHSNLMPSLGLNYLICTSGFYPSN